MWSLLVLIKKDLSNLSQSYSLFSSQTKKKGNRIVLKGDFWASALVFQRTMSNFVIIFKTQL